MTDPQTSWGVGLLAGHRPGTPGALALVCLVVAGCAAPPTEASSAADPATYASALVERTGTARDVEGLDALQPSTCATEAAQDRAEALAGAPELTHAPLTGVIETCGVTTAAENLSRASAPPRDVVDAWMESPGHRANILDPTLTRLGVACVEDADSMLCSAVFLGP